MTARPRPPAVILVRPQLAENIGAAARAMVNFGATDLRLVDPRPFDASHAGRMACDGRPVLENARVFSDLAAALADCTFSIATSRRLRRIKLPPITPAQASQRLLLHPGQPTALVFGAEQAGLTNEELFLCDAASTIPTTDLGSLNLGQSVIIYLYEWFLGADPSLAQTTAESCARIARPEDLTARPSTNDYALMASHAEKQRSYDLLEKLLIAGHYKPLSRLPEFMRRVKLLFETRPLTRREQRIFLKALRHLEKLISHDRTLS